MKTKSFRLLTVILTVVMLVALSLNVMAAVPAHAANTGVYYDDITITGTKYE